VPVRHSLENYKATVFTTEVGDSRLQVSVKLKFQGTLILLQ